MAKTKLYNPIKTFKVGDPVINLIDSTANEILEYDPDRVFSIVTRGKSGTLTFSSKGTFYTGDDSLPVLFAGELPKKILKVQLKITYEDE